MRKTGLCGVVIATLFGTAGLLQHPSHQVVKQHHTQQHQQQSSSPFAQAGVNLLDTYHIGGRSAATSCDPSSRWVSVGGAQTRPDRRRRLPRTTKQSTGSAPRSSSRPSRQSKLHKHRPRPKHRRQQQLHKHRPKLRPRRRQQLHRRKRQQPLLLKHKRPKHRLHNRLRPEECGPSCARANQAATTQKTRATAITAPTNSHCRLGKASDSAACRPTRLRASRTRLPKSSRRHTGGISGPPVPQSSVCELTN